MARIFNAVSCEAFLHVVTTVLVRAGGSGDANGGQDGEDAMEQDTAAAVLDDDARRELCAEGLAGFAALQRVHGLAEQPDILRRWGLLRPVWMEPLQNNKAAP